MEIYSKCASGVTVHHATGRWRHLDGSGVDGIWSILAQEGPFDYEPILAIYRDIENYLVGEYEIWADVTHERLVVIQIRIQGMVYSFDSFYEWKSSGRYLPNFKGKPDIRDRQLSHVRGELLCAGLGQDFDSLMAAWDLGVENLHFDEFRAALPTFLMEMLRRAARKHPDVPIGDEIVAKANRERLLSIAVRGLTSDREAAVAGFAPPEWLDFLNDQLEYVFEFQEIDKLVRYINPDDGPPDTDKIAYVISRAHFIEALYVFLVDLADARDQ